MEKLNQLSKCGQHKSHVLDMLQFSNKCERAQICLLCVNQYKIEGSELITVEEIINSSSQTIFKNYPPIRDQELQNKLNKLSEDILTIESTQQMIRINFSQFSQKVNKLLAQTEEKMNAQLNQLQDLKNNFVETYNQISSKNELKNLLLENKEENSNSINLLIEQKKKNSDQNEQQIKQKVLELESFIQQIDTESPIRVQNNICQLIEQINYFSHENQLNSIQQALINENNNTIQNKPQHLLIYELISNKTNYCSEQYLAFLRNQLNSNSYLFDQIMKFENQFYIFDREKRDSFALLNENQLEKIRIFSQDIYQIDKKYSNLMCETDQIQESIQPKSFEIQKILSQQLQYKHLKKSFSKLLREYPIFEIVEIPKQKSILGQVEIIKAIQEHSQKVEVEIIEQKQISITATTYKYAQTYMNFILNPQTKYVIRVNIQSFINSYENFIIFGLVPDQDKDNKLLHNDMLSYCERGNEFGMNRIIKGGQLHLNSKFHRNRNFEVRIHLSEKIYKIADYPKYEKVCEINDRSRLLEDCAYRFATELCYKDDKIVIQDILEVEQFDDQM